MHQRSAVAFRPAVVFAVFWIVLFLLYLPAARAGWVSDTLGWLQALRTQSFSDFVARKGFGVRSYYQLTQIVTWCLYQLMGANLWAWHLLQLSLHALNATILYTLLRGVFNDGGIARAAPAALIGSALFAASPYAGEVIVWEAAFHFLQGLLLILAQLHLLRRFIMRSDALSSWLALGLYILSLFSLEFFYITPILGGMLCACYGMMPEPGKNRVAIALRRMVLPQALILFAYLAFLRLNTGITTGRLGNSWMKIPITAFLVKPPECLFHLLGGRFLPAGWRAAVYAACSSYIGAGTFYLGLGAALAFALLRFRGLGGVGRCACFLAAWLLAGLALISPLWFPQRLLIVGDRYLYVLLPPFCGGVGLMMTQFAGNCVFVRNLIIGLLLLAQCGLTLMLSRIWGRSEALTGQLSSGLTDAPGRITVLLNSPASLQGAPMAGAGEDGETRLLHNLLYTPPVNGRVYDAPAIHLLRPDDSVHIERIDAQTIRVASRRSGAFWQWGPDVARSFFTPLYSVSMENPESYVLRLTYPADAYRLLYQQRGVWRELTMPR